MPKKKQQQKPKPAGPPKGLIWVAVAAVIAALIYVVVDSESNRQPPLPQTPPPQAPLSAPPVSSTPPPGMGYGQLVQIGNSSMDGGAFTTAINYYSAALAIDSTNPDVWVDRGACKHALGDEVGARADFRRGLELNPMHVIATLNMGIAYYTQGKADSARNWWNKVLILSPGTEYARRAQALLHQLDSLGN